MFRKLTVLLVGVGLLTCAWFIGTTTIGERSRAASTVPETTLAEDATGPSGHVYQQDRCPLESVTDLGVLVRVTPAGAAAGHLGGKPAKPLMSPDAQHSRPATGASDLMLVRAPADIASAKQIATELRSSALVNTAAVIGRSSRQPALHTCDGSLTDSPGARGVAAVAAKAMVDAGFVTDQIVADPNAIVWVVTDDPLDPSLVIVIAWVPAGPNVTATPFSPPPGGPPTKMITRQAVSALVNPHTGTVFSVGYSPF